MLTFPDQGSNPCLLQWKLRVVTTGILQKALPSVLSALSNPVVVCHMRLFKLKLIKIQFLSGTSHIPSAQEPHVAVATLSDRVDMEHVECGSARLDSVRLGQNPGIWISASLAIALEKAMATHSSTLAWKIPWTEEPGRLQSMDTTEQLQFHFSLSCIGEGNGNPLQCSCLENSRDRGAWWAAISGVAQSRTRLKRLSSSSSHCLGLQHPPGW